MQKPETLSWFVFVLAVPSVGWSAQTMTGIISDSQCGASHTKMIAMHKGMPMTEKQCTGQCVKIDGKYVLVSNGRVHTITNHNFDELARHAGEAVSLRGTVEGDVVTVTTIAPTKAVK